MKRVLSALLILFTLFFAVGGASAAYLDFFINPPTSGTITWAGTGSGVVGTGIAVDSIIGQGTSDTTLYPITNGILNFTTGPGTSFTGGQLTLAGGQNTLIEVWGSIPGLSIDNTRLMWGTFTDAVVINIARVNFGSVFTLDLDVLVGGFVDEKNALLAQHYGMPALNWTGAINLQFSAVPVLAGNTLQSFTSSAINSGDITNYNVPVPASLLLLGSGMVGLLAFGRKRFSFKA